MLLAAPPEGTLKGKWDRAILATLLYHGLRYEELCTLTVGSIHQRESVPHVRVEGKGDTVRYLPLHVTAQLLYRLRPRGIARLRQRGVGTLV